MPWADERGAGLAFLAFGHSFDAFEVQLRRMSGLEDGVVDALYRFSRPLTGGYYWCPPLGAHGLDLSAVLTG
ncbi:putative deferrochelatase/peroxidase YfeX [compost metagenome]